MSKAARELAAKLKPSYFKDTVAQRLAERDIDEAVAPLMDSIAVAPMPDMMDYTNPEEFMRCYKLWYEVAQKALKQWRE